MFIDGQSSQELTSAKGYGAVTENTGAKRLPEGWNWHCRPVSGTEAQHTKPG